jgi:phosphate transport system permease protein
VSTLLDLTAGQADHTPPPEPRVVATRHSLGDRIYRYLVTAGAMSSLVILVLIAVFLITESIDPLRSVGWKFLTNFPWNPDVVAEDGSRNFGIGAMLPGTVVIAMIALTIAVPVSVAAAIYINEYAPRRLRRALTLVTDLLAAIPSLIFGMWGLYYLQPKLGGIFHWLTDYVGWLPLFKTNTANLIRSPMMAGIVLSLMIIPIVTSVSREVMSQVPRVDVEGALALGGTRWGSVRRVILPYGRSGIVGAAMLGLGRALGETIAVALILSLSYRPTSHLLEPGGGSVAALIANNFNESQEMGRKALVAAGLALFVLTLAVNMGARLVVNRSTSRKGLV